VLDGILLYIYILLFIEHNVDVSPETNAYRKSIIAEKQAPDFETPQDWRYRCIVTLRGVRET
jgi:hypothetical protein